MNRVSKHKQVSFKPRAMKLGLALSVFIAGLWLISLTFFWLTLPNAPISAAKQKDAIIVLTGGAERVNTGITLLNENSAPALFVSGVNELVTPQELLDLWDGNRPVDPCCITLGHHAQNTKQNALEAKAWIDENDINDIYLVTSDYHMPRALIEFQKVMPKTSITAYSVESATNMKTAKLVFTEYHKSLAAQFLP